MKLAIVEAAGHHLYLDNPVHFHSLLFSWVKSKI
jgi:pimeloyl-ACP methyl ester carboxylesterase